MLWQSFEAALTFRILWRDELGRCAHPKNSSTSTLLEYFRVVLESHRGTRQTFGSVCPQSRRSGLQKEGISWVKTAFRAVPVVWSRSIARIPRYECPWCADPNLSSNASVASRLLSRRLERRRGTQQRFRSVLSHVKLAAVVNEFVYRKDIVHKRNYR